MLVVVHHRDVEFFLEPPFDLKGLRGRDVLQVDPPKGGSYDLDGLYEFFHIGGVQLDVHAVDVREDLEQKALSLHDRF